MTNFEFLKKYMSLQHGIMYDDLIDLKFATIGYCETDPSSFWNLALVNELLTTDQLRKIESQLISWKRKPAVYFEGRKDLGSLVKFLENSGYKKTNEDSWMFYDGSPLDERHFASVKEVGSPEELKVYLKTFDNCYQKNDPQNPYGELGDYLKVAEKAWFDFHDTDRLRYFVVFKNSEPVAVSTLTCFDKIGYISNVGSLRIVRGQGYGKAVTLYCVRESVKAGNEAHCLATEEGNYPNEFYKRIGFKTQFTAPLFTK